MNEQTLKKANRLEKRIRELRYFIDDIERIGNCSAILFKREPRIFAKRVVLPWSGSIEYKLDKETERRMLTVLKERQQELEKELESL